MKVDGATDQAQPQAHLVLIGGGAIPEAITAEILSLSLGESSRIVVCDWASEHADTGRAVAESLFLKRHGCRKITVLSKAAGEETALALRARADAQSSLAVLEECDVFFFTGGDQRILLSVLRGTGFERRLTELWRLGKILIAGTSAGLQIHSELALTGDFHAAEAETVALEETRCTRIARQYVGVTRGLGLLQNVILDQHFVKRQRQNRLISVVLDYPTYIGIGVDESTALVFRGRSGEEVCPRVIGDSCVFYVSARDAAIQSAAQGQLQSVENLNCGLVWQGAAWPLPIRLA